MKKRLYLFVFFVSIISSSFTFLNAQSWIGNEWNFRRLVTVTNPGTTVLTDYQVRMNLDNSFDFANANIDGSDVRITASDGTTELPFWIETWNVAGTQATIWVRIPTLPVAGSTVYLYYGNAFATATSNGVNTFNAYDGFENYALGSIPTSTITNPGEWERYAGNPLIAPGPTGSWDALGATFASVIYDDRVGEYRMYYHGYNSTYHQIGLATSPDGINWTKYAGNPIVPHGPSGSWDGTQTRVPMVWKEGITDYRMIYTGAGTTSGQVGYATSIDGINWTKYAGNPVFNDPTWAHNQTENWGVMKVGNEYQMWYSTWGVRQSGIAVSTDLINWTPHTPGPIFATNSIPSDDRYSQFCPFSFTYGGFYYVLVPSYSSVGDYSKFFLYRSSSPYFPESDRHLVRIAHTPQGVDAKDNDTPYILTTDIERSIFPNDELRVYYAGDPGSGNWFECLLIEPDIAEALSDAPLPSAVGNLVWTPTGTLAVVNTPVRQGTQSIRITNTGSLSGSFTQLSQGVVGAWMRRSTTNLTNDFDIYLYDVTNTLNCVAGLGRDGFFHHYSGTFISTGVAYSLDTWYLVTIEFNCTTNLYNFVVYNESMQEVVRRNALSFANVGNSTAINRGMLYTGTGYTGTAIADDYRVLRWAGADIASSVGSEETNPANSPFPIAEHFDYDLGELRIVGAANGWERIRGTSNDLFVISGNLTYSDNNYPMPPTGNQIQISNSRADDCKLVFDPQSGTGTEVYASFLLNVSNSAGLQNSGTEFIYLSIANGYVGARVSIKNGSLPGTNYNLGIGRNSVPLSYTGDLSFGVTYLIIFSYEFVAGTPNDIVKLWVNPVLNGIEPTATLSVSGTEADNIAIDGFFIRQAFGVPNAYIDGLRIGTDWIEASLPVELSSFSASTIGSTVKLNWRTETEVNNYGFDVERSETQDARGEMWEKIGFINGNGNSNSPKDYLFEDKTVIAGKHSYRLKQIDNDGQFEYSRTIEVDFGSSNKYELSQNYPNPFNPMTTIRFSLPESGITKLTLYNVLGQEVKTLLNENKEASVYTINFDASELNSGVYIYKLESGSFVQTRKMMLLK